MPLGSAASDNSEAIALLSGARPFVAQLKGPTRVEGTVIVSQERGQVHGDYTLVFNSPEQWREEIVFSNYTDLRILNGSRLYQKRPPASYPPLAVFWLERALHEARNGKLGNATIEKLRTKKIHGIEARCVELASKNLPSSLCFEQSGNLIASKFGDEEIEHADYESGIFPHSLRIQVQDRPVLEMHIEKISELSRLADTNFQPPSGITGIPYCSDPDPASSASKTPPHYPEVARAMHTQGSVIMYGIIGADGKMSNLEVISSPSRELASASLVAVSAWTYHPAQCDGNPIQTEAVITVNYSLSR